MSVTIAPATTDADIIGYEIVCYCGDARTATLLLPYAEVAALPARITTTCADDYCDGTFINAVYTAGLDTTINVSNINAAHLFATLGYEGEDRYLGSADANDFLGRILLAQAVSPADAGVPATTHARDGYATLIDCGRGPGYTDGRLAELRDLAQWCADNNRKVVWG